MRRRADPSFLESMIRGLYAITPDALGRDALCERVREALTGGAQVLQFRRKHTAPTEVLAEASLLAALCRAAGRVFIVNDDPALAVECGAHGVHLGRDDGAVAAARRIGGDGFIVGVSCYDDLDRARRAADEGADYVAFGSFFPSRVKPGAVRPPIDLLTRAKAAVALPVVAIGGITTQNAGTLIEAGADAVAVISDLFDAGDVRARAERFARLCDAARPRGNSMEAKP